jgi:hypothetical protein
MKLDTNYIHHCNVDVNAVKQLLSGIDDSLWQKNTFRQEAYAEYHGQTQSIVFEWTSNSHEQHDQSYTDVQNMNTELGIAVYDLIQHLPEPYTIHNIAKCMLVNLPRGCTIPTHVDVGNVLELVHRVHIPIITTNTCLFIIDGQEYNFKEGMVVEIDNTRSHSVINNSDTNRIHLIVDFI